MACLRHATDTKNGGKTGSDLGTVKNDAHTQGGRRELASINVEAVRRFYRSNPEHL